jgi:hypothetical protein
MTPTKQTRIREPRIKTLQIRVSVREYEDLMGRYLDSWSLQTSMRSFTDWLRQTLLKQTK